MQIETSSDKTYGIMLSGGLDSAVLLYLLIKNNPLIKLQPFTIPKFDGSALYADPIIDHFNKKFGLSLPKTILVGDPTVFHREQSTTAVIEIFSKYPVDYLYNALNQNPPELTHMPGAPNRSTKSSHPKILLPFVDLYKDQILNYMFDNGQEDLINITHSCTEQQQGRCNKCWQCTERKWAFKQLDKEDTGQL
jgi:hypothetical protein